MSSPNWDFGTAWQASDISQTYAHELASISTEATDTTTYRREVSVSNADTMAASKSEGKIVRVAAVQAEGCYFDLDAAVAKTCKLIEEAAAKGCDLIAFPEVWIPQYPGWIW